MRWRTLVGSAPGIGVALLPNLACPACWPAYAGALSALGVGFLGETRYLLPLSVGFLGLALATLARGADQRRGRRPLALGSAAAAVVLASRFVLGLDPVAYVGVALLVVASVWNAWPVTEAACPTCATCEPGR